MMLGAKLFSKNCFVLVLIIFLGLIFRIYNLDFPSIGYHNMKENEYLSIAEEMLKSKDLITRRSFLYELADGLKKNYYPQVPLVSYQILLAWKIFGNNLWGPRLFNVLFGLFSILVIYFMGWELFKSKKISLAAAFLMAVFPLAVFFSRNLQPESPALFFMSLAHLFYLKFFSGGRRKFLFLGGCFLSLAALYKFSFLFGILPFIFFVSVGSILKNKTRMIKDLFVALVPFSIFLAGMFWLKLTGQWGYVELDRIRLFDIFSLTYWLKNSWFILHYLVEENFTLPFVGLTLLGIGLALNQNFKGLMERYIVGWSLMILLYSMVFSDYIHQHNYYQMPFLPLVCLASVYALKRIADFFFRFLKRDWFIYLFLLVFSFSLDKMFESIINMHKTVFLGADVAGDSLREFTRPEERIFVLTHGQGYAVVRYAQRYALWAYSVSDFIRNEEKFSVRYICVYPAKLIFYLKKYHPHLFDYIENNYHFKEVGFVPQSKTIEYIILERGAGMDIEGFLQKFTFADEKNLRRIYKLPFKRVAFYTLRNQI